MSAQAMTSRHGSPADLAFRSAGARLRYRDEGAGQALVLIHGWTLDLEMWDAQVAAWRDTFRLVRLDRRGHGLSSARTSGGDDAADVLALCAHLGLERVALLGMSQGVRAALAVAARAPELVAALILDGPPELSHSAPEDDVPLAHYRALLRVQGIEALRRTWMRHPLMQLRTPAAAAHGQLAAMIGRYRGEDLLLSDEPGAAGLSPQTLGVPTLVLSGEHDLPSRVRAADRLCARLPHGERAVIAGAGHLANLDEPQAYNDRCRAFLVRHLCEGAMPLRRPT
jgi:3-oxoadipate enol-lactonase